MKCVYFWRGVNVNKGNNTGDVEVEVLEDRLFSINV